MGSIPRHWWRVAALAAIAVGAGMLLQATGWLQLPRPIEFFAVLVAAVLTSALASKLLTAEDWTIMPPSFVFDFMALDKRHLV